MAPFIISTTAHAGGACGDISCNCIRFASIALRGAAWSRRRPWSITSRRTRATSTSSGAGSCSRCAIPATRARSISRKCAAIGRTSDSTATRSIRIIRCTDSSASGADIRGRPFGRPLELDLGKQCRPRQPTRTVIILRQPTSKPEALPEIPTVSDFLPGYEASGWYGVGAPRRTRRPRSSTSSTESSIRVSPIPRLGRGSPTLAACRCR